MFIPVILGTGREGRESEKVARFIYNELRTKEGLQTQFIDVKDFVVPHTIAPWMNKPDTKSWQKIAARADGFIVVSPEYNHGYPGELKLLIDQALQEYEKKVVALVGVSSGGFGGVRVIQQLVQIFVYLKTIIAPGPLSFSKVKDVFHEDGSLKDESYREKTHKMLDVMIELTGDVKEMREKKK